MSLGLVALFWPVIQAGWTRARLLTGGLRAAEWRPSKLIKKFSSGARLGSFRRLCVSVV